MYKAAPVQAPFSLFKVEQTISRFYSESKVYLIKHNSQKQASEHGCVLSIVIGCGNPCELKSNSCEIATYSKTKCSRDHNLAVFNRSELLCAAVCIMSLAFSSKEKRRGCQTTIILNYKWRRLGQQSFSQPV